MKDKLYLYQIQLMWSYYQRAPVIVWFYTGTRWLLYAHKTKIFLCAKIGGPQCRNWHFGTSVVRSADIRYISISEDRSVDLGNPGTHKSTTHTPHRKACFPIRGTQKQQQNNQQQKNKSKQKNNRVTHTRTRT